MFALCKHPVRSLPRQTAAASRVIDVFRLDHEQPKRFKKIAEGLSFASPLNAVEGHEV
jgi:hypothetical protein